MLYTLRILSEEEEDFLLEIEILSTQTFQELHEKIQNVCNYDASQLSSFFICNNNWEKGEEITLIEMSDSSVNKKLMSDTIIGDFIKGKKQRIIYVFDFFSDRGFFTEVVNAKAKAKDKKYPDCVIKKGFPPAQIVYRESDFDFLSETEIDDDYDDDIGFDNIDDYEDYL